MKSSNLSIRTEESGSVDIFYLEGALDGHSFQILEERLNALLEDQEPRLVLVLTDLNYIASAGVGLIINFYQQAQRKGGAMALVKPSKVVQEIFNILGLDAIIKSHSSVEEGLQHATP